MNSSVKKHLILSLSICFSSLLSSNLNAADYTAAMLKACPEYWSDTTKAIEVKVTDEVWHSGTTTQDKNEARTNLASTSVIKTIDPADLETLLNDPLTMASECAKFRNFEVDTSNSNTTSDPETTEYGWIPMVFG